MGGSKSSSSSSTSSATETNTNNLNLDGIDGITLVGEGIDLDIVDPGSFDLASDALGGALDFADGLTGNVLGGTLDFADGVIDYLASSQSEALNAVSMNTISGLDKINESNQSDTNILADKAVQIAAIGAVAFAAAKILGK